MLSRVVYATTDVTRRAVDVADSIECRHIGWHFLRKVFPFTAQINTTDFVNGIRNALRGNVIEAIALCDETPGPVARVSKLAL
jgi:hypothetical protein